MLLGDVIDEHVHCHNAESPPLNKSSISIDGVKVKYVHSNMYFGNPEEDLTLLDISSTSLAIMSLDDLARLTIAEIMGEGSSAGQAQPECVLKEENGLEQASPRPVCGSSPSGALRRSFTFKLSISSTPPGTDSDATKLAKRTRRDLLEALADQSPPGLTTRKRPNRCTAEGDN